MPLWRYEAIDRSGKTVRGVLDAEVAESVVTRIGARGYRSVQVLGHVDEAPAAHSTRDLGRFVRALGPDDLGLFFRQLAALLRAGYTPAGALADLGPRSANPRLRDACARMASACGSGSSFAEALAAEGGLFPAETAGLLAAGEAGGVLPLAVDEAALSAELEIALRRGMGWVRFLVWQSVWSVLLFVPIFPSIDTGGVGKTISNYARAMGWMIPLGAGLHGAWALHGWLCNTPFGMGWRDTVVRCFPAQWRLARCRALGAFTRVLRALLSAGISPATAFAIATRAVPDSRFQERLMHGAGLLAQGKGLDDAVAATGLFDDRAVQLLTTGQRTGTWTEALDQVTAGAQEDLHAAVDAARRSARRFGILLTLLSMGYVMIAGTHGTMQFALRFADTLVEP